LHGIYTGAYLHFDSNGNLVGLGETGYWTLDAMLEVKKVSVEGGKLQISGRRIISLFDSKAGQFKTYRTYDDVLLAIDVDPTWQDPTAQLRVVLPKILTHNSADLAKGVPSYWDCWLKGTIERREKGGWKCSPSDIPSAQQPDPELPPLQRTSMLSKTNDGAEYYTVGKGVTPPKALKADDPRYPERAKQAKIQGTTVLWTIINEQGVASKIRIQRPVGGGLDHSAVEAVRQWRFTPAMKDGHPVPVCINIEVNFRFSLD
jgi:TonB family protein